MRRVEVELNERRSSSRTFGPEQGERREVDFIYNCRFHPERVYTQSYFEHELAKFAAEARRQEGR